MSHGLCENQPPSLGTSATIFGKMSHRLWENEPPTLAKSGTDFGKISDRFRENQPPILGKSATDFGKMSHGLWENEPPTWENEPPTLAKSATDFGKISDRFWEAPFLGNNRLCFWEKERLRVWHKVWENWFAFWIGLGQKLNSHCFERLACLGLVLRIKTVCL